MTLPSVAPSLVTPLASCRGVAQLVEHRSPKPGVAGSNPVSPAGGPMGFVEDLALPVRTK